MKNLQVTKVPIGDPKLGKPTDACQGFAIGIDIAKPWEGSYNGTLKGAYEALGAEQISIFDYYLYVNEYPWNIFGTDTGYNTLWLFPIVNETTTFPQVSHEISCFIIQDPDNPDPDNVAAGFIGPAPFTISQLNSLAYECLFTVGLSSGGSGTAINGAAADASGYFCGTPYPSSPPPPCVPGDPLGHCPWMCIFPPPTGMSLTTQEASCLCTIKPNNPSGGPFPACVFIGARLTVDDITLLHLSGMPGLGSPSAVIPETWDEALTLRAQYMIGGGKPFQAPGACEPGSGFGWTGAGNSDVVWGLAANFTCGNGVYVWNGSMWVCSPVFVWDGMKWQPPKQINCWDGMDWKLCGCLGNV
jgi:hypothetical protein